MAALPPPLTPPDSDLTGFTFMPLEIARFTQSDLVAFAPPEAVVAALLLWLASWHQRPAGSLTNDDRTLANLAGYGRSVSAWRKVKADALRGFIECSDGRLYHPVVAEKVRESWLKRLKQRWRNYCSAVRMHNSRHPADQRESPSFEHWLEAGRPEKVKIGGQITPQQDELVLPTPPPHKTPKSYAQQDEKLRATEADVARLNGSKGEGRDRDRETLKASIGGNGRSPSRAAALPKDWQPSPLTESAEAIVALWPPGMIERELDRFKDHASDKGRTGKDWDAAWRNWLRKADDDWKRYGRRNAEKNQPEDGLGRTARAAIAVFGPRPGHPN